MPYTKTQWVDRNVERPLTYTISNNPDSSVTLSPSPGTITQAGTQMSAFNMNKLEQGVFDANVLGTSAGTGSTLTLSASGFTLSDIARVWLKLHVDILDNATLNVNGTGAKTIKDSAGKNLKAGIKSGAIIELAYNQTGDYYCLVGGGGSGSGGASATIGSSTFVGSSNPRTIPHSVGGTNFIVYVTPTAAGNGTGGTGTIGEIWVTKTSNNFMVYNSGTSTSAFDYAIIIGQ